MLLVLLAACGSPPPPATPLVVSEPPTAEGPAVTPSEAASSTREVLRLSLGQPHSLDGVEIVLAAYEVERIEGDPEGHYESGVGVTLRFRIAGEEVVLSELPESYASERVGSTATHRVELVAHGIDDAPWAELQVDPRE